LYVREDVSPAVVFGLDDHLGLCGVGGVAVEVGAAGDPAFALSASVSSGDEGDVVGVGADVREAAVDEPGDEAGDPLVGLQLHEFVDPVRVEHVFQTFVFEGVAVLDEFLEGAGEVVLIGEVPVLAAEEEVESFEVLLVLGAFLGGEGEVFHFLYLEDLASEDLSDEGGFGDDDEVAVDFHVEDAVDGFDLDFLGGGVVTFLKLELLGVFSTRRQPE
jgi:hypothetical protein